MELKKIKYSELNGKQKEIYNFQKIAWELADFWFNCIKLSEDWQWADFLAYHINGKKTLKVQLKARITIDKKYLWKNIFIAFPVWENWYIIEHDTLVEILWQISDRLNSESWLEHWCYSSGKPSLSILKSLEQYKL